MKGRQALSIHSLIEQVRNEAREGLNEVRGELRTMAYGGAVTFKEMRPTYSRDLNRYEAVEIHERRVFGKSQELATEARVEALHNRLDEVELKTRRSPKWEGARRCSYTASAADRLAYQVFEALVDLSDVLGMRADIDERGRITFRPTPTTRPRESRSPWRGVGCAERAVTRSKRLGSSRNVVVGGGGRSRWASASGGRRWRRDQVTVRIV